MRSKSIPVIFTVFVLLQFACGGKRTTIFDDNESIGVSNAQIEERLSAIEKVRREKWEKGDTLALDYAVLANYIPEKLGKYVRTGEMAGSTLAAHKGLSYSTVHQAYVNEQNQQIELSLVDYNAAYALFNTVMAFYSSELEVDNADEVLEEFTLADNIKGWRVYHKQGKEAEIFCGIDSRFALVITAENQVNTKEIFDLLKEIDLNKLADL